MRIKNLWTHNLDLSIMKKTEKQHLSIKLAQTLTF